MPPGRCSLANSYATRLTLVAVSAAYLAQAGDVLTEMGFIPIVRLDAANISGVPVALAAPVAANTSGVSLVVPGNTPVGAAIVAIPPVPATAPVVTEAPAPILAATPSPNASAVLVNATENSSGWGFREVEEVVKAEGFMKDIKSIVGLSCSIFCLIMMCALRDLWLPPIQAHMRKLKIPSVRNIPIVGWCCSICCFCLVNQYHPNVRIRIHVKEAWKLRPTDILTRDQVYVAAACGNNPIKATSIQRVPASSSNPVVWDEVIDVEAAVADTALTLQVMDYDAIGADDVCGTCTIDICDILDMVKTPTGRSGEKYSEAESEHRLLYDNKNAGLIVLQFATAAQGKPMPPYVPGTGVTFYGGKEKSGASETNPLLSRH